MIDRAVLEIGDASRRGIATRADGAEITTGAARG